MRLILPVLALTVSATLVAAERPPAKSVLAPNSSVAVSEWIDPKSGARYLIFIMVAPSSVSVFSGEGFRHIDGVITGPPSSTFVVMRADLPDSVLNQPLEKKP